MKKAIKILMSLIILFSITGCLSKEEKKIVNEIEINSKKIILNYLKRNYNISNIDNLKVRFEDEGSGFGASYERIANYTTANFNKNNEEHIIICNYKTEKCYDTYAYNNKVNPILVNKINETLKSLGVSEICAPDYVSIKLNYMSKYIHPWNYYEDLKLGVFNNEDSVNNYNDIINYYNQIENNDGISHLQISYQTEKIITNNLEAYNNLSNALNSIIVIYNEYNNELYNNQKIYSEYFAKNPDNDYYNFYSNKVIELDNFIFYWENAKNDNYTQENYENFEFNIKLEKNTNEFEQEIKYFDTKYYLYNSNILIVENIGGYKRSFKYFLKLSPCKNSKLIYKDKFGNLEEFTGNYSYTFQHNETSQKFALYCPIK